MNAKKKKSTTVTFRVSPRFKRILKLQAERHRMSVASLARVGTVGLLTAMLRDDRRPPDEIAPARPYRIPRRTPQSGDTPGSGAVIIPFPVARCTDGDESA